MTKDSDGRTTDTKKRILASALRLFAEQGFNATSMAQIASAVGISAPALYKHFDGKQAIFQALLDSGSQAYGERMEDLNVNFLADEGKRAEFIRSSSDEQVRIVQELFLHTLNDELPSRFRKLMTAEQFGIPQLATQYNRRYVDDQYDSFEALMREFIDEGILRSGDARAMAVQYASPITIYIEVCDREPERVDEALEAIANHIRQFNEAYRQNR